MTKSILITGVAGSGKSAVCGELKKRGYKAYNIEEIEGLFTAIDKTTGKIFKDYDDDDIKKVKRLNWICDKNKLLKLMRNNPKNSIFYCGIASNLDELLFLFDKIFLLKANPKILCERLSTRKSNDFGRTPEVQKWILSWKKQWEDRVQKKGAIIIDADKNLKEVTTNILKKSKARNNHL